MLRFLVVLALVAGLGGAPARPAAAGGDPLVLVGWWRVATTGETVVIDPARFEVRTEVRTTAGSWVGDGAGRFLALSYGVPPGSAVSGSAVSGSAVSGSGVPGSGVPGSAVSGSGVPGSAVSGSGVPGLGVPEWVATAAGFAVDGPDRVLLDRAGGRVALLVPAPAGTVTGAADPARPPSEEERRAGRPRAPLPPGRTPVGDPTGRWVPIDDVGSHPAYVDFAADGTWTGSDGCTGTGGSWLAAPDGAFLATARSLMTFVACPGVGVAPQVGAARRIGTYGATLVLLDADGAPVGHFRRA